MAAGLKRKLLLALKKVAEQNCRGKFLRNVADLIGKGPGEGGRGGGGESHLILDKLKPTEMRKNIEAAHPFFQGSK